MSHPPDGMSIASGARPQLPYPSYPAHNQHRSSAMRNYRYTLDVVQQPVRARMCGKSNPSVIFLTATDFAQVSATRCAPSNFDPLADENRIVVPSPLPLVSGCGSTMKTDRKSPTCTTPPCPWQLTNPVQDRRRLCLLHSLS